MIHASLLFAVLTQAQGPAADAGPGATPGQPIRPESAAVDGPATPDSATAIPSPGSESTASLEERIADLAARLSAVEKEAQGTHEEVEHEKALKISGYVQGRWSLSEASASGLTDTGAPRVKDGFSVRRGRLKATYTGEWLQLMLQVDASSKGVSLKDAEAHFMEPWSGYKMHLILGQTKWPFGFEVNQSSADRELPERTRVVKAFLPGERDRGVKATGKIGPFFFLGGVFDGNGTENKGFTGVDNDTFKDGIGRLGLDFGWLSFAGSGWYGITRQPGDPVTGAPHKDWQRWRVGGDVQLHFDLLPMGPTDIRGEVIGGETWSKDGVEQFGKLALGGYAIVVQNFWEWTGIAVRYDHFDGDLDAAGDAVDTIGLVAIGYLGKHLKASVSYEIVISEAQPDPKDNVLTVQLQARF